MKHIIISKACFTGYRPEKFDFKLDNNRKYKLMVSRINETIKSLYSNGCNFFYCGMAPGFDIIAAECVLKFKKNHNDIRLVCAVPYYTHKYSIPDEWLKRYTMVLKQSEEVIYITEAYHISSFQLRNQYMVDMSDCVICWYDGKKGGTKNTINYAQKQNKYIININIECDIELNNLQDCLDI